MSQRIDITGQRFGKLLVTGFAETRAGRAMWSATCDCGVTRVVQGHHLGSGHTTSCGCIRDRNIYKAKAIQSEQQKKRADEVIAIGSKPCRNRKCEQANPQPLDQFPPDARALDGKNAQCRSCTRDSNTRLAYGITSRQREEMIEAQGRRCANQGCRASLDGWKMAHLDHDHASGQIRGVLCKWCNLALGYLKDSPERITGLAQYAASHRQLRLVK